MNKRFYVVSFILLCLSLGAAYVLTSDDGQGSTPTSSAPADQGLRINP